MNSLIEYSEICDLVKGISDINLNNIEIYKKQLELVENEYDADNEYYSDSENDYIMVSSDIDSNNSVDNSDDNSDDNSGDSDSMDTEQYKRVVHFQDSYNDMDYILSLNLMEVVLPFSEYLTSLINNFLLEKMIQLIDIKNDNIKNLNISSLIEFYHFSLEYIKKFYSFKEQLDEYDETNDDLIRKERLKKYARNLMNKDFSYKQLCKIVDFLKYMNKDIDFEKQNNTYKDLTPISKTFLIKIKHTTENLIEKMEPYIEYKEEFKIMKIYKKLEFIVPFMNIIQLIFYILIKNPIGN
jgi:hypothetical protein